MERAFHLISSFGVHQNVLSLVIDGTETLAYLLKCSGRDKALLTWMSARKLQRKAYVARNDIAL